MNICVFGDSIAWGAFDMLGGGWVDRLKMQFMQDINNNWIELYNLGISGSTTDELVKRFEIECQVRYCDVAIIALGINDAGFRPDSNDNLVSIDRFQENMKKVKEIADRLGIKIIFVGLTHIDESINCNPSIFYQNSVIDKYDDSIRDFCMSNSLTYIRLKDIIFLSDLSSDGDHLNEIGHEKIADEVYKHLKTFIYK